MDQSYVQKENLFPLIETAYNPQADKHADLFSSMSSPEQRHGLIVKLNQTYGNKYVQRLIESMDSSSDVKAGSPGTDSNTSSPAEARSADQSTQPSTNNPRQQYANTDGQSSDHAPNSAGLVQQTKPVTSVQLIHNRNGASILVGLSAVFKSEKDANEEDNSPVTVEETSTLFGADDSVSSGNIILNQQTVSGKSALGSTWFGSWTPTISKSVSVEKIEGFFSNEWKVTATMTVDYTYSTQSLGKTDIPNANVPAVTEASWPTIYSDLMPGSSAVPRSPRTQYWCSDLSTQHELFHIMDCKNAFTIMAPLEEQWLEEQTLKPKAGKTGATNLGMTALNQLETRVLNYMGGGDVNGPQETRAYGAGISLYQARAQEVKDRAVDEGWTERGYNKVEGEIQNEDEGEEQAAVEEEEEEESWWESIWNDLWEDEEEVEAKEAEIEAEMQAAEEGYGYGGEGYGYGYGGEGYGYGYGEEGYGYGYGEEGYGYGGEGYGYGYGEEDYGYGYGEEDYGYGYGEEDYGYGYGEEDYGYGYGEEDYGYGGGSYNETEGYIY